ncbi:MAG: LacI family DNA-binding transcriptional regulator [Clostridia bacterium]|nr:LacI family DNA-binding transcriptional regulator [Clostridia bacterium]
MSMVTLKDIAKVAGVSYATVSRALSGSSEIGEDTRKRILKLCEEMGYTPNAVARSMVMKRTNILGLIVASLDNPFMSELTTNIEIYARRCGYNLMVCNSSYDVDLEKEVFTLLVGRQVDGIILLPISSESYESLKSLTAQVPTVFISENLQDLPEDYVAVDNRQGMRIATEYLYSLGHRKILYFGCRSHSVTHRLRLDGYRQACESLGIEADVLYSPFSRSSHEAGYQLADEYFSGEHAHTAMLCATDSLAIGVMRAAFEHNISIPDQLSLMGFDNISFAALPPINLTSIDQPKQQMATAAVDLLLDRIAKPEAGHTSVIVPPSLVERRSAKQLSE